MQTPNVASANNLLMMLNESWVTTDLHGPLISDEQIDDFIILRARAFTSRVRRTMAQDVLQNENLSVLEWRLLFAIARFGSCHVAYVTKHTSIDPAHGSRAASTPEKKGLITRIVDPANKRAKLVSLSTEGTNTINRIWPKARKVTADLSDRLTPSELAELKRLLDIVNGKAPPKTSTKPIAPQNGRDELQENVLAV